MANRMLEKMAVVPVLAAAADRYNTNPASDVISLKLWKRIMWIINQGEGATGTATVTVEQCSAKDGTGAAAIAFRHRIVTSGIAGAWVADLATGYTLIAGAAKTVVIEIEAPDVDPAKPFVRLQLTEVVNDPCTASIVAVLSEPRYFENGDVNPLS